MSNRTKPPADRRGLSFPVPLLDEVKEVVMKDGMYRSMSEFITEAIREKLRREKPNFRR